MTKFVARQLTHRQKCKVLKKNVGLVIAVIARLIGCNRAEYGDLYQHGCLGLLEAARRFEPERKIKFSTYASTYIFGHAQRFIQQNSTLTTPTHIHEARQRMKRIKNPTKKDALKCVGITKTNYKNVLAPAKITSLSKPVSGDDDTSMDEILIIPEKDFTKEIENEMEFEKYFTCLNPRQKDIIKMIFQDCKKLKNIAKKYKVSKQRIYQIKAECLEKIRQVCEQKKAPR